MYAFAPVSLGALRRSDPERARPYRLPAAGVLSPLGFVAANLIIYWSSWQVVWKLGLTMVLGLVLFGVSMASRPAAKRPLVDVRASAWIVPWLGGLAVISFLGQYGGRSILPEWIDLVVVTVFGLAIYYMAVGLSLPARTVKTLVEVEERESQLAPDLTTAG